MRLEFSEIAHIVVHPLVLQICSLLLVILIGYELTHDFFSIKQINNLNLHAFARNVHLQPANHVLPLNLRGNLFGVAEVNIHDSKIKPSLLKITLVGLVYSDDAKLSEVIVHTSGVDDKSYHVGDEMPGGIKIERITKDGMVINRDGTLEKVLYFTKK